MNQLLGKPQKKELISLAYKTLRLYVEKGEKYSPRKKNSQLNKQMAAFVTLRKKGNLRGCIGSLLARGPLYLEVRNAVIFAASRDPRFALVEKSELKDIQIEISVLSGLEKIDDPAKIILGEHGVMVKKGDHSGLFLPQVATEAGWSKTEFMAHLCRDKAGLPVDCWKENDCEIFIFKAEVFS